MRVVLLVLLALAPAADAADECTDKDCECGWTDLKCLALKTKFKAADLAAQAKAQAKAYLTHPPYPPPSPPAPPSPFPPPPPSPSPPRFGPILTQVGELVEDFSIEETKVKALICADESATVAELVAALEKERHAPPFLKSYAPDIVKCFCSSSFPLGVIHLHDIETDFYPSCQGGLVSCEPEAFAKDTKSLLTYITSDSSWLCASSCSEVLAKIIKQYTVPAMPPSLAAMVPDPSSMFSCMCGGTLDLPTFFELAAKPILDDDDFGDLLSEVPSKKAAKITKLYSLLQNIEYTTEVLEFLLGPKGLCGGTCPAIYDAVASFGQSLPIPVPLSCGAASLKAGTAKSLMQPPSSTTLFLVVGAVCGFAFVFNKRSTANRLL